MKNKATYYFAVIIGLIIVAEIAVRISGVVKTHTEKTFNTYTSPYHQQFTSTLFTFSPNDTFVIKSTEYEYSYITNENGLAKTYSKGENKDDTTVILGDSFTFGAGAPQDSSMPALLNKLPNNNQWYVNAGMPGSDPFFEAKLMQQVYLPKGYKNFVYVINVSDLYDYIFRGGNERFLPNGKISINKAPWYEPFYHYSHVCRALIHVLIKTDFSLLPEKEIKLKKLEAIENYVLLFKKIEKEIRKNKGTLTVVLHPYPALFSKNISPLSKEVMHYSYMNLLHEKLLQNSINTLNIHDDFAKVLNNKNYLQYSWEIDGHFNAKGYQLFDDILNKKLNEGEASKQNK